MTTPGKLKVDLVVPESAVSRTGNRCAAWQWAGILEDLGHVVTIIGNEAELDPQADLMVAIHAWRSHSAIERFRKERPDGGLILVLGGTDIYPEPNEQARESIERADRLVVLQRKAFNRIPITQRKKARMIIQSAQKNGLAHPDDSHLDVCVVGHLRDVKDSMRTAEASRLLPAQSKIRILHAGGIHESKFRDRVERERRENPRYEWLGELDEQAVANLIASSRLMVVSSHSEGGARVVGEAMVHGTPVISSRIDGVIGLLDDDYPGYFSAGDTGELAGLLDRFETDPDFSKNLKNLTRESAPQFAPELEEKGWKELIDDLAE